MRTCLITFVLILLTTTHSPAASRLDQSGSAARITNSSAEAIHMAVEIDRIEPVNFTTEEGVFSSFIIDGEGGTYRYGQPILPSVGRFVIVPPEAGLELIVHASEPERVQADPPPLLCLDEEMGDPDRDLHNANSLYPTVIAEMGEPIVIRGVRMVKVTTYPVQYDKSTNEYLIRDNIEAEIRFTDAAPVNPVHNPDRPHLSQNFRRYLRNLAINADDVFRDNPGSVDQYVGRYLIVTHPNCLEFAVPWIEFRRKTGYKMDIIATTSGASQIKTAIRNLYNEYVEAGEEPFDQILLIGDRQTYTTGSNPAGWQLQTFSGISNWGNPPHSDYDFATIDGNDIFADVGISRWCAGSENMMELFVRRTMLYEAEPDMDDPEWFTRAAVFSQHWGNAPLQAWHPSLHTAVRWATEVMEQKNFTVEFYEEFRHDRVGTWLGPWEIDRFDEGTNLQLGRAEDYYWRSHFNGPEANTVFPIRLVNSGHGEWTCWNMLRNGGLGNVVLKGPVAATCGWGGPTKIAMNTVWLELVRGHINLDLPLGWARVNAVTAPEAYLPDFDNREDANGHIRTDFDCYGDPGIQYWKGVPQLVEAELPRTMSPDTRMIEVYVHDQDDDEIAIPSAQVTAYYQGDMPDADDDDYADYDEMFMMTGMTDSSGMIRFVFPENVEFAERDVLFVTVSGREIRPYYSEIDIETPNLSIEVIGYLFEEVEGNEDDHINPGETFNILLTAVNNGNSDIADVTAVISSPSPYVEIEENEIAFGDIDSGVEAESEESATIIIAANCPDGASRPDTRPDLIVEFSSGDDSWRSGIKLDPYALNLEIEQIVGGDIVNVGERQTDIEVVNIGRVDASSVQVRLTTLGIGINVMRGASRYDDVPAGETSRLDGQLFTVTGNSVVVPGMLNPMALVFTLGEDVIDSALFSFQVREPGENTPQGPDDYGYVCFDNTDQDWDLAPDYEWIEISTYEDDRDFNGTACDFPDDENDDVVRERIGNAIVVELGFTTQFYGTEYEEITIASNGFICPGDQPLIVNFQNWPMDHAMGGGAGMIAPLWDDLTIGDGESGVFYYHDANLHMFIVEWYNVEHMGNGDDDLTFQVWIFDKRYWITATGDPMIVFQYKRVSDNEYGRNNLRNNDRKNDVEFASIGISSPDGSTGLNYSFHDVQPVTSGDIGDRTALLFATSTQYFRAGYLEGYVYDHANGEPLEDVSVFTSYGFADVTDANGYWVINEALAETDFTITATKAFFNDTTYVDTILIEDDSLSFEVRMLHPEIEPSDWRLTAVVDSGFSVEIPYSITNPGNGPLYWSVARRLPRGADVDPWEHRLSYNFGQQLEDPRIEGVVFANDRFYLTGGGGPSEEDNQIYVLDRDGRLVDVFPQPDSSRFGIYDITWDGELLWGGSGSYNIYGFTTEGELIANWRGPNRTNQAITWDPDRDVLWISGITSNEIIAYNTDSQEQMRIDQFNMRIYGLAYWPDDPDGYPLYVMNSPDLNMSKVYKIDIENEDTLYVATLEHEDGGTPRGIYATNQFDVYSWVLMAVANDAAYDRVDVWQIDARRDWFQLAMSENDEWIEASEGTLNAWEDQEFILTLDTEAMPILEFDAYLWYTHNAVGFETVIDVNLEIIGPEPPDSFSLTTPRDRETILSNTEVEFAWEQSVDRNHYDEVNYKVWFVTGEDTTSTDFIPDISTVIHIDSLELIMPSDTTLTWWVQAKSGQDVIESNEKFSLNYMINDLVSDASIPVEFGLHSIYPSPFNSVTRIKVGIDRNEPVRLTVYDLQGREVVRLIDGYPKVGYHEIVWDAGRIPSGLYMLKLEAADRVQISKIALIR